MPFYSRLKINPGNSDEVKAKKRRTIANIKKIKAALRQHFEASGTSAHNQGSTKIATWNLRDFGAGKFEGRSYESLHYIAEIMAHFDLVALQEIKSDLREFRILMRILGPEWCYIATDVTDGRAGNGERMVFAYNETKVQFRNIAGELSLPENGKIRAYFGERIRLENGVEVNLPQGTDLSGTYSARLRSSGGGKKLDSDLEIPVPQGTSLQVPPGSKLVITKNSDVNSPGRGKATVQIPTDVSGENYRLRFNPNTFDDSYRQFARSPFLMSFQSGWLKLNLCTVHIYYGDDDEEEKLEQRRKEIEKLVEALSDKAESEFKYDYESFLGVLGDFNIVGHNHPTMEALESHDFVIPDEIKAIPGSNVDQTMMYDQIAFWNPGKRTKYAKLEVMGANVFDFFEYIFTDADEATYRQEKDVNGLKDSSRYRTWRTYKMSDHLPMWIELKSDFSEDYLDAIDPDTDNP